jgi:hypothetical protein
VFTPSPSLTGGTTYYAVLVPYNTYGNGQISFSSAVVSGFYTFSGTLTFTPAGATGSSGPTLSQCRTAYASFGSWVTDTANFNMTTQGNQRLTVPTTRNYTITCAGAGAYGAIITTTISLTAGHILNIIIGQAATSNNGSGGSFVINATTSSLLIASGGAGANGNSASLGTSGIKPSPGGGNGGTNGSAGSPGSGYSYDQSTFPTCANDPSCTAAQGWPPASATISYSGNGGGGGGGNPGTVYNSGYSVFGGGGGGGTNSSVTRCYYTAPGYFSGGFSCTGQMSQSVGSGFAGGGGGGGYSGGGGGFGQSNSPGGGGGSFCSTTITSSSVTNLGSGYVSIT